MAADMNGRKLKLAVVGTKFISDLFVRGAVLSGRYELHAICSRSRERGEQYARKFGFRKAVQTVDEAAADPEVDIVYLATPNTLHFAQARLCLASGKHVIVEKPSVVSTQQLSQLQALAAGEFVGEPVAEFRVDAHQLHVSDHPFLQLLFAVGHMMDAQPLADGCLDVHARV